MTRPNARSGPALLSLVFVLLAGCGSSPAEAPPDGAPDGPPVRASRLYALRGELDLTDVPGAAGSAVGVLIAATDDPDDPTRYLVDRIVSKMDDGTWKTLAEAAEPLVTSYVNERLLANSPELLTRLVAIGRAFGQAAHHLGTLDTLEIAPDGSAVHAITGIRVTLDGQVTELGFADHDAGSPSAAVAATFAGSRLALGQHTLPLSLGKTLRLVLDGAIVPHVDPGAVDLVGVLQNGIDCEAFGQDMTDALGFGSPDGFAAECRDAVTELASTIYAELDAVDADALELELAGSATAVDTDRDGVVDGLVRGTWTGTVVYAGTPAPLAAGTFSGSLVQ